MHKALVFLYVYNSTLCFILWFYPGFRLTPQMVIGKLSCLLFDGSPKKRARKRQQPALLYWSIGSGNSEFYSFEVLNDRWKDGQLVNGSCDYSFKSIIESEAKDWWTFLPTWKLSVSRAFICVHGRSRDFFSTPLDHYLTLGQQVVFQSLKLQEVPIFPQRLMSRFYQQVNHQRT